MTEALIMFGISTVFGIISTIFWRWVSNLSKTQDDDSEKISALHKDLAEIRIDIAMNYQNKTDAHRDNEQIMSMLKEIKADVNRLSDKLDRKADK